MVTRTKKIATTGMLMAVGVILPFISAHGLGFKGTVLLPMHIPAFLIGLLCGPFYGAICGGILPLISSIATGMPEAFPSLPIMMGELCTYGFVSGFIYNKTPLGRMRHGIYPCLVISMVFGRIAYGFVFLIILTDRGLAGALGAVGLATASGVLGIILQFLMIPPIVTVVKSQWVKEDVDEIALGINLIKEEAASCIIIKNNRIVRTEKGRGIAPIISIYESGILKNAYVVDKIIGKAGAMVLTLGGITGCYARVMSATAKRWFEEHGVAVNCELITQEIRNRNDTGMCPMEETVQYIDDEKEALSALKKKLKSLREESNV